MKIYIIFMAKKDAILYPRAVRVANPKDVIEMIDDCDIDNGDYLDVVGIGKLYIKDIKVDNDDRSLIIHCVSTI